MQLTKNFVKAKNPARAATNGSCGITTDRGDYQAVLDALVADGRVGDACWLLDQFGPTDAVLRLDEIDASAVVFAGTIEVRRGINVDSVVRAGRGIIAGGGIRAGESVIAGENIQSGAQIASAGLLRAGGDISAEWGIETADTLDCAGNARAKWMARRRQDNRGRPARGPGRGLRRRHRLRPGLKAGGSVIAAKALSAGCGIQPARPSIAASTWPPVGA